MLLSLPHHMYDMYCNVYHCVSESYSYSLSSSHLSSSDYHSTSPACYRYSSCSYDCSSSSFCIVIVRHLLMLVVSMSACASFNCFTLVFTLFHCYSCVVVCVCVCVTRSTCLCSVLIHKQNQPQESKRVRDALGRATLWRDTCR